MRSWSISLVSLLAATAPLASQDEVVYYKFDAGAGGDRVINFAPNSSPAPPEGTVVSSALPAGWSAGRFGYGLAGLANLVSHFIRVESGWAPGVNGDFTYAFFLRMGWVTPTTGPTDLLGVPVAAGFHAFVNGSSLITAGIDGTAATFSTNADIWQMALAGWVHVAFVVDTSRGTATYYVNGVPDASFPLSGGARITAPDFWVGQHLVTRPGSVFDLDEVRILTRTATPLEVQAWASDSTAASAEFGTSCGARVIDENGPPVLGNGSYSLRFGAQIQAAGALALGSSRFWLGAVPLPFDLGAILPSLRGCLWQTSADLAFPVMLDLQGGGAFGLGIPLVPSLRYRPIFVQALFTDGVSETASNVLAISIGS